MLLCGSGVGYWLWTFYAAHRATTQAIQALVQEVEYGLRNDDLAKTDVKNVNIDLGAAGGGGDQAVDTVVLNATKVCKTGKVYNLGLPIQKEGMPILDYRGAPRRYSLTSASDIDPYANMGGAPGLAR